MEGKTEASYMVVQPNLKMGGVLYEDREGIKAKREILNFLESGIEEILILDMSQVSLLDLGFILDLYRTMNSLSYKKCLRFVNMKENVIATLEVVINITKQIAVLLNGKDSQIIGKSFSPEYEKTFNHLRSFPRWVTVKEIAKELSVKEPAMNNRLSKLYQWSLLKRKTEIPSRGPLRYVYIINM